MNYNEQILRTEMDGWKATAYKQNEERQVFERRIKELEALLKNARHYCIGEDADNHASHCSRVIRYAGPCDCIVGKIDAALAKGGG